MGVAFREVPAGRSRWRLAQSRDRGLQGSTQCGYCVHGSHLQPTGHDRRDASTPAARVRNRHHTSRRALSNAPPTATPSSVMGQLSVNRGPCPNHQPRRGRLEAANAGKLGPGIVRRADRGSEAAGWRGRVRGSGSTGAMATVIPLPWVAGCVWPGRGGGRAAAGCRAGWGVGGVLPRCDGLRVTRR